MESESGTPIRRRTVLAGLGAAAAGAVAPAVIAPEAARAADKVKFRPGHYVWVQTLYWVEDRPQWTFDLIEEIRGNRNFKGIILHLNWKYFESARGNYQAGFEMIDDLLRRLAPDKHLIVQVTERGFGGTPSGIYPKYVVDTPGWVVVKPEGSTEEWAGGLQSTAKFWTEPVMTRLIELSKAYAARYNTHTRFAMFGLGETALAHQTGVVYSDYYAQIKRWFTESKKVWTKTPLRLSANYTRNDLEMLDLFQHVSTTVVPGGVAIGGPDPELALPVIDRPVQANRLFRGEAIQNPAPPPVRPMPPDRRGVLPWIGEVQGMGLGERGYKETPEEIFDYFYGTMHANYMVWLKNTNYGTAENKWPAIKSYVDSIGGRIHRELPTLGEWELG